jgi:hypothetical protein
MRTILLILLAFTGLQLHLVGQEDYYSCGTQLVDGGMTPERLQFNKSSLDHFLPEERSLRYVPVKFHLVAQTDGSGRALEKDVLSALCRLNLDFAATNVRFYLKDGKMNFINNTTVFNNPTLISSTFSMRQSRDQSAMNIFITQTAVPNTSGDNSIIAGFYSGNPDNDWIVIRKDALRNWALPHEVGHYLSLLHTHHGWDAAPYDKEVHGSPAPVISPGGPQTERVNRNNCDRSGDNICDTPADYNGLFWNNCNYTGGALDPDSVAIDPDERNFMSYFSFCPRNEYRFSQEQINIMQSDVSNRSKLATLVSPTFTAINDFPELLNPPTGANIPLTDSIVLTWKEVAGATHYLIEVDRLPTFVFNPIRLSSQSNSVTITQDLLANTNYYWRIIPYNPFNTCSDPSRYSVFRTLTATNVRTIEILDKFEVNPLPVKSGQDFTIQLSTIERFDALVSLFDLSGKEVVRGFEHTFYQGENTLRINTGGLPGGMYVITLKTEYGIAHAKVPVIR